MEGNEITAVREMTDEEYDRVYWPVDNMGRARVLELDDGTRLFASCDTEGNASGFLSGLPTDTDVIVGETIENAAPMSTEAMGKRGWPTNNAARPAPPVIVLSSGHEIYTAADGEENGPGALFGFKPGDDGDMFTVGFE